jgi:hypothetical protein
MISSGRVRAALLGEMDTEMNRWGNLTNLIMVAGHTVYMGDDFRTAIDRPEEWYLVDYQRTQLGAFQDQIREGVRRAWEDSASLLLFSGSATRARVGPRSEGASYWLFAEANVRAFPSASALVVRPGISAAAWRPFKRLPLGAGVVPRG